MMNAITNVKIDRAVGLEPEFSRNYAKVSLKLTMDAVVGDDYKVTSVRLRNIPKTVTLSELALGPTYSNIVPSDATIYPYGSPLFDYPAVPVTGLDSNSATETFSWYVPRNQQGTLTTTPAYKDKSYYAPINATYFEVIAQRISDNETAVFRVYPGANQTDDFTLLPNHAYTSSLVVKGIGDSASPDSRVENFDNVDYSLQPANCYMLHPAPAGGRTRKYTIPITPAITYWTGTETGYGSSPANGGISGNIISGTDPWTVSFMWSDHTDFTSQITFDNSGTGIGDGTFTLNVPAGLPAGNFTVKLASTTNPTLILWSWHFWVTDYNPDIFRAAVLTTPGLIDNTTGNPGGIPDGKFTYPVPNGQVERYASTIWRTGGYAGKVMMDRNLGAVENFFTTQPVSTTSHATTTRGHLHYQFGRKDPFPSVTANATGVIDLPVSDPVMTIRTTATPNNDAAMPMADAVRNPTTFYNRRTTGNNWCSDANGGTSPSFYVWNDPEVPIGSLATNTTYAGKSIYDPCPPGWKMPANGIWDDFAMNRTTHAPSRDLGWTTGRGIDNVNGIRYWPGASSTDLVEGRIYYPPTGYRQYMTGAINQIGNNGDYWVAVPSTEPRGRNLYFTGSTMNPQGNDFRSYGFPVRCVAE